MRVEGRRRSWEQRAKRERREESAYLFDAEFTKCYGTVPREQWEGVIAVCTGDIVRASQYCGIEGVPVGARALWGQSPEDALAVYKAWQDAKKSGAPTGLRPKKTRNKRPAGGKRGPPPPSGPPKS
jgi:hypothetical protein